MGKGSLISYLPKPKQRGCWPGRSKRSMSKIVRDTMEASGLKAKLCCGSGRIIYFIASKHPFTASRVHIISRVELFLLINNCEYFHKFQFQ